MVSKPAWEGLAFLRNGAQVVLDFVAELMTLIAQGKVQLHTSTYPLEAINGGRLQGRGILIPEGSS